MKRFVVRSIRPNLSWINGVNAHLDEPVADGTGQPQAALRASGWVASAAETIEAIFLECRGRHIATAKLSPRSDVEQLFAGRHVAGFEISAVPAGMGEGAPLRITLKAASGRLTTLFEIGVEYGSETGHAAPDVVVAPLVALPRSGTTRVAELLHASSAVFRASEYPHELRLANYLANEWFNSLQPWSHVRHEERGSPGVDPNYSSVSRILREANADGAGGAFDQHFDETRREFRERMARLYRLGSPAADFSANVIVEKIGIGADLELLDQLAGPLKPIFLVRDPRDVIVSMRSFNERRQVYEFFDARSLSYPEIVLHCSVDLFHFTNLYDQRSGDKLLIRYEDLVAQPAQTRAALFSYLGIENAGDRAPTQSIPADHLTSANADASVGRWKSELSASEAARAEWHLRAFLERFGY